jgi:hypothetical protein
MYLAQRYAMHFLGAALAAFYLYVLLHDEFEISRQSIFMGALGSACVLGLAWALGAAVRRRKRRKSERG